MNTIIDPSLTAIWSPDTDNWIVTVSPFLIKILLKAANWRNGAAVLEGCTLVQPVVGNAGIYGKHFGIESLNNRKHFFMTKSNTTFQNTCKWSSHINDVRQQIHQSYKTGFWVIADDIRINDVTYFFARKAIQWIDGL